MGGGCGPPNPPACWRAWRPTAGFAARGRFVEPVIGEADVGDTLGDDLGKRTDLGHGWTATVTGPTAPTPPVTESQSDEEFGLVVTRVDRLLLIGRLYQWNERHKV